MSSSHANATTIKASTVSSSANLEANNIHWVISPCAVMCVNMLQSLVTISKLWSISIEKIQYKTQLAGEDARDFVDHGVHANHLAATVAVVSHNSQFEKKELAFLSILLLPFRNMNIWHRQCLSWQSNTVHGWKIFDSAECWERLCQNWWRGAKYENNW